MNIQKKITEVCNVLTTLRLLRKWESEQDDKTKELDVSVAETSGIFLSCSDLVSLTRTLEALDYVNAGHKVKMTGARVYDCTAFIDIAAPYSQLNVFKVCIYLSKKTKEENIQLVKDCVDIVSQGTFVVTLDSGDPKLTIQPAS